MAKIIYDSNIIDLLEDLKKDHRVFVPIVKDPSSHTGGHVFSEYEKGQKLDFSYPVTVLPPKEFLLPPNETLFKYKDEKIATSKVENQIIFGVSLEDLAGINKLDKLFSIPIEDEVYKLRRESTIVVAVDKYSPPKNISYDLYLMKIEEGVFAAFAGSKAGQKLLKKKYFKNHKVKIPNVSKQKDALLSDPDLPRAIEKSKDHPIWSELAEICFGCGICSYVCPLCYCFEVEDKIEFSEENCGERCRSWDSCMLKSFAETSSHNFRSELRNRIYNWYFHKFVRMPAEHGFSGCVDCHRCIVYCPAEINYRETLATVLTDYKKKAKRK